MQDLAPLCLPRGARALWKLSRPHQPALTSPSAPVRDVGRDRGVPQSPAVNPSWLQMPHVPSEHPTLPQLPAPTLGCDFPHGQPIPWHKKSSLAPISAPRRTRAHPFSAHPSFPETAKTPNPSFSKGHDKCRGAAVIKKGGRPTAEKKKFHAFASFCLSEEPPVFS